jgi:8-oxo-dGTP pyrophosphatase MutT (NUDIX family)
MNIFWRLVKKFRVVLIYKILRMKTCGVRVVFLKKENGNEEILLVNHPYDDLWVFPGGTVSKKISPEEMAIKESEEEVGLIPQKLTLFGTYKNTTGGKNDEVHLFKVDEFVKSDKKQRLIDRIEIQKMKWFDINDLPEQISIATRNRILEIKDRKAISSDW